MDDPVLKTSIGGDLTDRELRDLESIWDLEPNSLAKGTRTGPMSVHVLAKGEIHKLEIKLTVEV